MPTGVKNLQFDQCSQLNKKFCKTTKVNWGVEIRVLKTLLKTYSFEFLLELFLPFKLNTLVWFLSEDGKEFLSKEWSKNNLVFIPEKKYKLEETKIGPDVEIKKEKKSLIEFLQ